MKQIVLTWEDVLQIIQETYDYLNIQSIEINESDDGFEGIHINFEEDE